MLGPILHPPEPRIVGRVLRSPLVVPGERGKVSRRGLGTVRVAHAEGHTGGHAVGKPELLAERSSPGIQDNHETSELPEAHCLSRRHKHALPIRADGDTVCTGDRQGYGPRHLERTGVDDRHRRSAARHEEASRRGEGEAKARMAQAECGLKAIRRGVDHRDPWADPHEKRLAICTQDHRAHGRLGPEGDSGY